MTWKCVITAEAKREIAEAVHWYEEQQASLGVRFWVEFKRSILRIKAFPELCPPIGGRQVRKASMHTFPYSIYYRAIDGELRVLGVIHGARSPKAIKSRIT